MLSQCGTLQTLQYADDEIILVKQIVTNRNRGYDEADIVWYCIRQRIGTDPLSGLD